MSAHCAGVHGNMLDIMIHWHILKIGLDYKKQWMKRMQQSVATKCGKGELAAEIFFLIHVSQILTPHDFFLFVIKVCFMMQSTQTDKQS